MKTKLFMLRIKLRLNISLYNDIYELKMVNYTNSGLNI